MTENISAEARVVEADEGAAMTGILDARVDCLWDAGTVLGEGLTYDHRSKSVWFVDIKARRLFSYDLGEGTRKSWTLPVQVTALATPTATWKRPFEADHAFLCVGEHGFGWLGVRGEATFVVAITHPEATLTGNRFNDGKLGPDGRFYAGTMDDNEVRASGALYAFDPNGSVTRLDEDFRVTNGPAFSADGRTLYANDSALRLTYAYRLDSDGHASDRRVFHHFTEHDGYPDGMTSDAAGNIWIAMWDGGKIQRLDRDGRKTGFISTPVRRPTNLVVLETSEIIFTSAATKLSSNLDGALFRASLSLGCEEMQHYR